MPNLYLKQARTERGWSQQQLANVIGVDVSTVIRWEKGGTRPYPFYQDQLQKVFQKPLAELGLARPVEEKAAPLFDPLIPPPGEITLVGREEEVRKLHQWIGGPELRIVLKGLPGVGKTALAIALVHDPEVQKRFEDGILWATLGPKPHLQTHLNRWGTLFSLPLSTLNGAKQRGDLARIIRNKIGNRRMLLVLDDICAGEDALALHVGGPNCRYLLTTRFPLVATQLVATNSMIIKELRDEEGLALLRQLAPLVVAREPQRSAELSLAVGGLPLALLLMGNYLRTQTHTGHSRRIAAALQRLNDAHERLHLQQRGQVYSYSNLPSHLPISLSAVIATTDQQLEPSVSAALHALAILPPKPESFSEQAALMVAACSLETLDALQDHGLLESAGERYLLPRTIADYGREQLSTEEKRAAEERLLLTIISALNEYHASAAWLVQEIKLVHLALEAALTLKKHRELIHIMSEIAPFLLGQGWVDLAQYYLQQACMVARQQAEALELPYLLLHYGKALEMRGQEQEAFTIYREGLLLARRYCDHPVTCDILAALAWKSHLAGEYQQADIYLAEGMELAQQLSLHQQLWSLFCIQGSQLWARGSYTAAEEAYRHGLRLLPYLDERAKADVSIYYCFLGMIEGERGNDLEAETYFAQGLEASELYGRRAFRAFLLVRRTLMRLQRSSSDTLREDLSQASDLLQETPGYALVVYQVQAHLELAQGHIEPAERAVHQAFALLEPFPTGPQQGELLTLLAQTAFARRDMASSAALLAQAIPIVWQYGTAEARAMALATLGDLALEQGDLSCAEQAFHQLFVTGPAESLAIQATGYYGLARVAAARSQWREAKRAGEKSLILFETLRHRRAPEVRAWLDSLVAFRRFRWNFLRFHQHEQKKHGTVADPKRIWRMKRPFFSG